MSFIKYFKLLNSFDFYIRRKATGSPDQFASKLGISRRSILRNLKDLKELGIPIRYSKERNSYYYSEEGKIVSNLFECNKIRKEEMKKITGGVLKNICWEKFPVPEYCI